MKVEIWTDVICPWCGLGEHRFRQALEQFEAADDVEIVHRSFQLAPDAELGSSEPSRDMLIAKGYPADQIATMTGRIEQMAADEGLQPYVVGEALAGSTAYAHEFLAYATSVGRGDEAWDAIVKAHWGGEGRDVFTLGGVVAFAQELGFDAEVVREELTERRWAAQVRDDQSEAQQLGATGVPFFVIDRRYGVGGAQPAEQFLEVLQAALTEPAEG